MSFYPLLLFLHVSAALVLFIGTGIWAAGVIAIGRASRVEQVRVLSTLLLAVRMSIPVGAFVVIAAGVVMTRRAWGFQTPWIVVTLASLCLIGAFGTWVIDPRVRQLARLADPLPDGPLPVRLAKSTHDPVLCVGLPIQLSMLFGVVFLMTVKPILSSAVLAMIIALFLGLLLGVLIRWRQGLPRSGVADIHLENHS
jgi:hypothetical protein